MQKLLKVITNELENTRLELESKLDNVLKNESFDMATKKELAIEVLGDFAIAEISNNLWTMYITPPKDESQPEDNTGDDQTDKTPTA